MIRSTGWQERTRERVILHDRWPASRSSAISAPKARAVRASDRATSRQVRDEKRNDLHTVMGLAPGTRLGVYEIVGSIGAGGMGEVYRARDSRLGRDVAVKVLPEVLATDRTALARFE